jgi:Transglycosylase SLT domain
MLVDSSNSAAGSTVTGAIRQAAQATGTSFQYLLATAQVESGLDPQAGASTSSARGLFQFVEQTWLGTMKQSGQTLGYGRYADAITKTASGRYEVNDPALRNEILKLRTDPAANAVMAGAFTQANAALLSQKLGRAPSEGELYIAHFLGAGGAARMISLAAANPQAGAASYFPIAAHANSSIFYDRATGAQRSLAQVRDILTARYDVAARRPSAPVATAQAAAPPSAPAAPSPVTSPRAVIAPTMVSMDPTVHSIATIRVFPAAAGAPAAAAETTAAASATTAAVVPDTAGMTSAFAAAVPRRREDDGDAFHGLFADPGRTAPVAAVVSELWGVPSSAPGAGAGTASAPTSAASGMLDLFRDPVRGT